MYHLQYIFYSLLVLTTEPVMGGFSALLNDTVMEAMMGGNFLLYEKQSPSIQRDLNCGLHVRLSSPSGCSLLGVAAVIHLFPSHWQTGSHPTQRRNQIFMIHIFDLASAFYAWYPSIMEPSHFICAWDQQLGNHKHWANRSSVSRSTSWATGRYFGLVRLSLFKYIFI